jgi:uncharacterized membrane protein
LAIFTIAKGTGLHRVIGYIYVLSMLGLNLTALTIYRLFGGFGPFHVLAIISLITLAAGFIPAFTKRPKQIWLYRHYEWILWSYVGLVAAAASEVLTRVPFFDRSTVGFALAVLLASSVIIFIGASTIYRKREKVVSRVLDMLRTRAT